MDFLKNIFRKKKEPIKTYEGFWTWFNSNSNAFFKVVKSGNNIESGFSDKLSPKLDELKKGI